MEKSKKFKYISNLESSSAFTKYVPPFYKIEGRSDKYEKHFSGEKDYILRSSLLGESSELTVNSGKSLSFKNIGNFEQFESKLELIQRQENLDQVYLQEQFNFTYHLTMFMEGDLCIAQFNQIGDSRVSYLTITESFITGEFQDLECVREFYSHWQAVGEGTSVIIEAGTHNGVFKLFQVIPAPAKLMAEIFNDDLIVKLIKARYRSSERSSLLRLLKTEYEARKFRKKKLFAGPRDVSLAFKNWEFLFHYFYLFVAFKNRAGTDQDFADFLNFATRGKKTWPTDIIFRHLELAGKIREGENAPELPSAFKTMSKDNYFIGPVVQARGLLLDIALKVERLTPEFIYNYKSERIILTTDNSILSHGFLAAAEQGIPIIGNINQQLWESLSDQDVLTIDFKRKQFGVQFK